MAKRRVLTSVPAEVQRRLKAAVERRGTYQTELLLDAYGHHHRTLRKEFSAVTERDGLPARPRPRRRHVGGGVATCVLFLSDEERGVIDECAGELGMSRSELVTHLLERELASEDDSGA